MINEDRHPILYGLVKSVRTFLQSFYMVNDNYKQSFIFNNPLIKRSRDDHQILDTRFFTHNLPLDEEKLAMLRFNDMMLNNWAVPMETINFLKGLNINLWTYMRIIEALSNFLATLKRNRVSDSSCCCPIVFLNKSKKGSKHIRKILSHNDEKKNKNIVMLDP